MLGKKEPLHIAHGGDGDGGGDGAAVAIINTSRAAGGWTTGPGAATLGCDSTGHQDTTVLLLCSPAGSLCACSQSSVPALQYLASVISHGDLASYSRAIPLQPATIPALCVGADHCGHKANVLV